MKSIVKKWNLDRDVRLNHRVVDASWIEDQAQWRVTVQQANGGQIVEYADVLISGQGFLK